MSDYKADRGKMQDMWRCPRCTSANVDVQGFCVTCRDCGVFCKISEVKLAGESEEEMTMETVKFNKEEQPKTKTQERMNRVGAAWEGKTKNGKEKLSIHLDENKQRFIAFRNSFKTTEKHPDWLIYEQTQQL